MLDSVREVLLEERRAQEGSERPEADVDGVSGFIFQTRNGTCLEDGSVASALKRIVRRYNEFELKSAEIERRKPILLPIFTTHDLRHTFCTRLCEHETNLKVIQEVMGHADISTTMNIYNEATMQVKMNSFKHLEGKII
jgi:integrase